VAATPIRDTEHDRWRRPLGSDVYVDHEAVLHLRGDLDCASAPNVSTALQSLTAGSEVVVACDELEFIDAAGLRVLIAAAPARGERGRVLLRDPSASTRRLIEVAEIDGLVVIVDTDGHRSCVDD